MGGETPLLLVISAARDAARALRQGFGPLNWNSLSVDDFLERNRNAAS